jgi:N-acetylmuramic acid 6-phosphate (MurNAc-6-P) etherase
MDPIPGGGGEAEFAQFAEDSLITAHSGTNQVVAWDIVIGVSNASGTTFDVNVGKDLIVLKTGCYIVQFYSSIDSSVISDADCRVNSWTSGTRLSGIHKRFKTGNPDTESGMNILWAIPSAQTPPFTIPLELIYTSSGTSFGMGLGGMIFRIDT